MKAAPKGTSPSGMEKPAQLATFEICKEEECPKGNACEYWHPPECFFHQEVNCVHRSKCAFKHTDKARSEPRKRNNSVVVAKTVACTKAEDKVTSLNFIAKGDFLHGVSAIPVKSILQNVWDYDRQENSDWLASQSDL